MSDSNSQKNEEPNDLRDTLPPEENLEEPEGEVPEEEHLEVTETDLPAPYNTVPAFEHGTVAPWAASLPHLPQLNALGSELLTQLRDLAENQIEVPLLLSLAEHAVRKAEQIDPGALARFIAQLKD